jgi:Ca2+-binding RTX toxin-like protein
MAVVAVTMSGLTLSATSAEPPRCQGESATIVGSHRGERIRGTAGADVIVGGGGRDIIAGLGGDDVICSGLDHRAQTVSYATGGAGDDRMRGHGFQSGGAGDDTITTVTERGGDHYGRWTRGGKGDDLLRSDSRLIRFDPGPGRDRIITPHGPSEAEVHFATATRGLTVNLRRGTAVGDGHDTLSGTIHQVFATKFSDVLIGNKRGNHLYARGGDDTVDGHGGPDYLPGGRGDDRLDGGAGNDVIAGDAGRDMLLGRTGNDLLDEGRTEANLILAGPGDDTCVGDYLVPPNVERGCESHRQPVSDR